VVRSMLLWTTKASTLGRLSTSPKGGATDRLQSCCGDEDDVVARCTGRGCCCSDASDGPIGACPEASRPPATNWVPLERLGGAPCHPR
jgi:hypothetical protein